MRTRLAKAGFSLAAGCLVLVGAVGSAARAEEPARVLRAGAATSNITPPLGELIVGGWVPYPAQRIHDELHARCLVLDNGQTRLAIVLCDNVGIPREVFDRAKQLAHKATGLDEKHMLMAATHTHSATTARSENKLIPAKEFSRYQTFLAQRIANGVARAIGNLEPARIGWGRCEVPEEVFNRRWFMAPGKHLRNPFGGVDQVRMNPPRQSAALRRPAGPVDPEVCFLSVQSTSGRPIALLANYSLHYVGGVPRGEVSADYFAIFADRIGQLLEAKRLDPPFVGILSNGTSGDVNNINFRAKRERRKPYEKMREVAYRVAERVYEAHQDIKFRDWVPLDIRQAELTLGVRKPTEEQLAWAKKIVADPDSAPGWHGHEKIYARRVLFQHEAPDEISVPLQALRIGEVAIAAIPFEVFAEIGLEIKAKKPLPMTFTIELANGSYGYLPTPRQHAWGGYETWLGTNSVEVDASTKIVRTLEKLFEQF